MKRKGNWPLWIGFILAVGGLFAYDFFAQFPITRDFPWANLLLFGIGGALLLFGLFRAFGRPQAYRGKIFGSIFTAIAFLLFAFFTYEIFYVLKQIPLSAQAPRLGEKAPAFSLPDQNGKQLALADLLSSNGGVLIFYRGHW
jgi:hypothetical protein